jgi:hypothetical protein
MKNLVLSLNQQYDLQYALKDAKAQLTLSYVEQIIAVANQEGFSLQEIFVALAEYVHLHPEYQKAGRHLDLAAEAVKKV